MEWTFYLGEKELGEKLLSSLSYMKEKDFYVDLYMKRESPKVYKEIKDSHPKLKYPLIRVLDRLGLSLEEAKKYEGLCFIQEVEMGVDPKDQPTLCQKLSETFPKIRFFATTNSPLILSKQSYSNIHLLTKKDGEGLFIHSVRKDPRLMTSFDIYLEFLEVPEDTFSSLSRVWSRCSYLIEDVFLTKEDLEDVRNLYKILKEANLPYLPENYYGHIKE